MMTVLHRFRRRSPVRGGFTMVELLVVISIIALVIALVLPAYNSITSSILRRKVRATIAALESGCKRFKSENAGGDNNYPPGGAVSLLKCLTGSGMPMAVSGGGFQNFRPGGKVFGPYIDPDTVKIGTLSGSPVFKDAYGNVLAYYVRNAGGGFEGGGDPSISDPMAYCRRTSSAAATVDLFIASPGPNKQYGATAWDANDGDDIVTFVSEE